MNEQFENTGSVELRTSARGRKNKLSEENLCQISKVILETPDITLQEIIDKLQKDETYVYYGMPFIGKYEPGFGIAKLEISKEEISKLIEGRM